MSAGDGDGRRPGGAWHRRRRTQFAGAARRAAACGRRGADSPYPAGMEKPPAGDGRETRCLLPHGLVQGAGTAAGPAVPSTADGERSSPEPPGGRRPAAAGGGLPYPAGMEKPPAMRSGVVCTVIPPAGRPWGGSPDRRGSKGYRPNGR